MNSKFQHRHYAAIADVLADAREGIACMAEGEDAQRHAADTISELEDRLCAMFKRDNYGFKPDRFRAAATRAPNMHGRDKVR